MPNKIRAIFCYLNGHNSMKKLISLKIKVLFLKKSLFYSYLSPFFNYCNVEFVPLVFFLYISFAMQPSTLFFFSNNSNVIKGY